MPTRLLYEKICDSATLAELTGDEERLFHRLVVKADDYGRFHAHPSLLLGHCFPLLIEKIGTEQVRAWRDRLEAVGLIELYTVEGREYLQIVTWTDYQRQRGSKPKFPPPLEGAETRGGLPQASADCGSRVVKDTLAGGRRPEAGSREPEAGTSPQPPPQAEGAGRRRPPRSRQRANGVMALAPADPPPKLPPGEEWIEPGHPDYSPLVGRYKRVRV